MTEEKDDGIPMVGPTNITKTHEYIFNLESKDRTWTEECVFKWYNKISDKIFDSGYVCFLTYNHANGKVYDILSVFGPRWHRRKILKIIKSIEAA